MSFCTKPIPKRGRVNPRTELYNAFWCSVAFLDAQVPLLLLCSMCQEVAPARPLSLPFLPVLLVLLPFCHLLKTPGGVGRQDIQGGPKGTNGAKFAHLSRSLIFADSCFSLWGSADLRSRGRRGCVFAHLALRSIQIIAAAAAAVDQFAQRVPRVAQSYVPSVETLWYRQLSVRIGLAMPCAVWLLQAGDNHQEEAST